MATLTQDRPNWISRPAVLCDVPREAVSILVADLDQLGVPTDARRRRDHLLALRS